jgi:phosphoadenosine phosphosulfate reductase
MPQLIRNGAVAADRFTLLRDAASLADVPTGTPAIVPLALWQSERSTLRARGDVGVWLAPSDDPATLSGDIASLPLIAVDFPQFADGRGYSIARLLRDMHGFRGELRAIGDVLRDQLYALAECGFDAFAVRADRNAEDALAGLAEFAGVYAATSRTPEPRFQRRAPGTIPGPDALGRRVADAVAALRQIAARHAPAVLASSFGAEDMVLIDLIARENLPIRIFTLDTGRLPEETHALIDRVRRRYGLPIDVYAPDTRRLQAFVRENGVNAFYDGVELRKACCAVRKTEPLQRALVAKGAWVTGLRRAQSATRANVAMEEFDTVHSMPKFNPLVDWSETDVWSYLRGNDVPYNALHDRGYASIGCAPCTRAIQPGEDVRAGRWWWEDPVHKECGLHPRAHGTTPRAAGAPAPEGVPA